MIARTALKQVVMFAYNHGWISGVAATRVFVRFDLRSA